ncbi:sucrase ferredoxin [Angustibacter peucedani]
MTAAPADPAAPLFSVLSAELDEPAYGSAATARLWLALEQNGPWGRVAATDSHLDPDVGAALDALAGSVGGRFALVRRPGRHADDDRPDHRGHEVLVAWACPVAPWLLRGRTADPRQLLALDPAALAVGDADAVVASAPELGLVRDDRPELLVCTNGRRDLCCAVRGRPVALGAARRRPGQVWETSHTGGHRFAPTAVLLPSGVTLARLDPDLAVAALDGAADGALPVVLHGPRHDRGRSALAPALQAAESAVRADVGEVSVGALVPVLVDTPDDATWVVQVRHADGRAWARTVRRTTGPVARPASCGKPAEPEVHLQVSGTDGPEVG